MEEFKLPKLFMVSGYSVYFWSNENNEPIHVHVAKGKPTPNATKIWLTKSGGCILASNGSKISNKELNELMEFISALTLQLLWPAIFIFCVFVAETLILAVELYIFCHKCLFPFSTNEKKLSRYKFH